MKNFLLVPNFDRNPLPFVRRAVEFLRQKGCSVFCQKEDEGKFDAAVCSDPASIDCILVFGGDGTMLKNVKKYLSWQKPFAGINTGKVGYLADIDPEATEAALASILNGKFSKEERVTLKISVGEKTVTAINEAVLHRSTAHVLGVEIGVNGQRVEPVRADGIIVATPTGSTAYNLSAGGPILTPNSRSMVVTPVCAHSLTIRPVVIGGGDIVTITVKSADEPAFINVDGEYVDSLPTDASVNVSLSEKTFTLLRLSEGSFFTVLRNKLSTWEQ